MGDSVKSSMNLLNQCASSQVMEWVTRCGSVMTTLRPKPAEHLVQTMETEGHDVNENVGPRGQVRKGNGAPANSVSRRSLKRARDVSSQLSGGSGVARQNVAGDLNWNGVRAVITVFVGLRREGLRLPW